MRYAYWHIPALCLLPLSTCAPATDHNLVFNRPYDYWPEPNYDHCTDDGDRTQLTDGYTNYQSGRIWVEKPTVGWCPPPNVPVVIRFDLGEPATLSELRFNTTGGGAAGVVDVGLRVYVSLDDKVYIPAGERPPPDLASADQGTTRGIQMIVPLKGVKARYVAVAGMAPPPHYFVFVDEIEMIGSTPADPRSSLPVLPGIAASGAKGLQELFAGGCHASLKMRSLLSPLGSQLRCWPASAAEEQRKDTREFEGRAIAEFKDYERLCSEATARHRALARRVYGADTLVWEVPPDDAFGLLSLPDSLKPAQTASVHTVVTALEATALGAANLSKTAVPLKVRVTGGGPGAPKVTSRVARFAISSGGRYVPDVLLATDSPQVIPSGEARLVWLGVESTGAKPGSYKYTVAITIGDRQHSVPLDVRVHNVVLSNQTPLSTGNWSDLNEGDTPLLAQVRDSMLGHRITVGATTAYPFPAKDAQGNVLWPLQLDFTSLDKSLAFHKDFPQFSLFFAFNQHGERPHYDWFGPAAWMSDEFKRTFREWIGQLIKRIKASGRDYDEFCFMMFDETLDEKVGQLCQLVHSVDPKVRMMITIPQADRESTKGLVAAGMNIFAYHAPTLGYNNAPDGMGVLSSGGRELWLYNAAAVAFGVGKETDPLNWNRYLHWTAFRYGATGVHFWNMLHNRTSGWLDEEPAGAAYYPMVYPVGPGYPQPPAEVRTSETVIPSRRWEYVRMGIEDYTLLAMARERIAKLGSRGAKYQSRLDGILDGVLINRAKDRKLFRRKRRELVELVEALAKPG
ncbi:MAG: hypothetical protein HY318_04905 [Armatimonadetes bacterium]|nr:hypothetical protein [Armatimonadota bacterium]